MASPAEQIKERLGIAEVVGSYLKLERSGVNMRALCPFHSEKTPSFFISPTRGSYYCFGCGAKGDIFSFVEAFEGLDFMGALKLLGERAGVPIVFESKEKRSERDRLFDVLEEATSFFERGMTAPARSYLNGRGVLDESIEKWRLGFASPDWRVLRSHLRSRGFSDVEAEKAGLIKHADEGGKDPYDRFRGRIMFPIGDSSGRIVAFSGRIFPNDDKAAKYINSPETLLFVKSKVLYGFDRAKGSIRKSNFSVLVEGQMDLVMAHQGGFPNTIALSGTALSGEHLETLGRLSKRMVIALDADKAGISSAGKSAKLALSRDFDVKVASLPAGLDPADVIAKDPEKFRSAVREAKHIVDFYLDVLKEKVTDERKLKLEVSRLVLPFVAEIKNGIDRAHFVSRIAYTLHIAEEPVWEELRRLGSGEIPKVPGQYSPEGKNKSRKERILEELFGLIFLEEGGASVLPGEKLQGKLTALLGEGEYAALRGAHASRTEELLFAVERLSAAVGDGSPVLELLSSLETEMLKESFAATFKELKKAEGDGDEKKAAELLLRCQELSKKLGTGGGASR